MSASNPGTAADSAYVQAASSTFSITNTEDCRPYSTLPSTSTVGRQPTPHFSRHASASRPIFLQKYFWGEGQKFLRAADASHASRREGPYRFTQKRPRTFVAALKSDAAAERSKNQLLRDFSGRSIFDFCNNIRPIADVSAPSQLWARNGSRQLYSITSSARASIAGGISRPSAFAVLRLTTSSNLVGC